MLNVVSGEQARSVGQQTEEVQNSCSWSVRGKVEQILGDHYVNMKNISNSGSENEDELRENGVRLLIAKETARSLTE